MMYDLNNPLHRESFKVKANALVKKGVIVELTEKKPQRSENQNKYLHVALGIVALEFGETMEYVKEYYFKRLCNRDLFVIQKEDKRIGMTIADTRSSADLSTAEMTTALERFRNWAAGEGCYIPSPDEHRAVQMMEVELSRNRQFLYR